MEEAKANNIKIEISIDGIEWTWRGAWVDGRLAGWRNLKQTEKQRKPILFTY